jgi:hypothetical protein
VRLAFALLLAGCIDPPAPEAAAAAPTAVIDVPGGPVEAADCVSGCAAPTPDETHPISIEEIDANLVAWAEQPIGDATLELETLLFHGRKVSSHLTVFGGGPLDAEHLSFLQRELARDHVEVHFRLVDAAGNIRGERRERVPLKDKQHLALNATGTLGHAEVAGKVKRVGLHHLWTRW